MALQSQKGRDVLQHVTQIDGEAEAYVGKLGELSFQRDIEGAVTSVRAHNHMKPGGYVIAVEPAGTVAAMLPNAKVVPPIEVEATATAQTVTISHQLGYMPLVQLTDGSTPFVVHDDLENVSITFPAPGTYTVLLR